MPEREYVFEPNGTASGRSVPGRDEGGRDRQPERAAVTPYSSRSSARCRGQAELPNAASSPGDRDPLLDGRRLDFEGAAAADPPRCQPVPELLATQRRALHGVGPARPGRTLTTWSGRSPAPGLARGLPAGAARPPLTPTTPTGGGPHAGSQFECCLPDVLIAKAPPTHLLAGKRVMKKISTSAPLTAWWPLTGCTRAGRTGSVHPACSACTATRSLASVGGSLLPEWRADELFSPSSSPGPPRHQHSGNWADTPAIASAGGHGQQPVEREQGPCRSSAAGRARGRCPLRPHGGHRRFRHTRAIRPVASVLLSRARAPSRS